MPAAEVRDDLDRVITRREELQALLEGTAEEPVILHPNMAEFYHRQVTNLAATLNTDENRAEAADLIRSLVERIILIPNAENRLEINQFAIWNGVPYAPATSAVPTAGAAVGNRS